MEKIYYQTLKETLFHEKLENGLEVYLLPKIGFEKTYGLFSTRFGSIDTTFVPLGQKEMIKVEDGIAHFLEHKMFDMENGDAADEFAKLGASSNAFTSSSRTAYLFSTTTNENDCIELLLDFVQSLNITDESVEKEKGIIGQEIMMYDDYPDWKVYLNALECMYHKNPVKLDITGTVETISHIDKEILYKCYNTFYNPSNMAMVISGDFEPEKLLEEIKKRLIDKKANGEIKRIFEDEPKEIVKEKVVQNMEVSQPLYAIGIKDVPAEQKEKVKKHISIEVLLNLLIGASSELYKELYDIGNCYSTPSIEYEFDKNYAHILIIGQSTEPEKLYNMFKEEVRKFIQNGVNEKDFERIKKMIYGEYVKEYDDVVNISRMFLSDYFKGINSFDYLEEINTINVEYLNQVLKDVFNEKNMILSVVKN